MRIGFIPAAEPVTRLIEELGKLPGIGPKSAARLAYYLLRVPEVEARALAEAIIAVKDETVLCSHCQNMMPIVQELESEGYNFYWAESSSADVAVVSQCLLDAVQGGVPEFICAGTGQYELGAVSKSVLKAFADSCK